MLDPSAPNTEIFFSICVTGIAVFKVVYVACSLFPSLMFSKIDFEFVLISFFKEPATLFFIEISCCNCFASPDIYLTVFSIFII